MRAITDLGPNRWPRIADGFPRFARRRPPSPPTRLPAQPDGTLLACQGGAGALIRIDPATKAIETLATELVVDGTSRKLGRVNDLSFDATGGIYVTDPALGKPGATSGVPYRDTAGAVTRVDTSVDGPNGACGADAPGRPSGHS